MKLWNLFQAKRETRWERKDCWPDVSHLSFPRFVRVSLFRNWQTKSFSDAGDGRKPLAPSPQACMALRFRVFHNAFRLLHVCPYAAYRSLTKEKQDAACRTMNDSILAACRTIFCHIQHTIVQKQNTSRIMPQSTMSSCTLIPQSGNIHCPCRTKM